MASRIDFNFKQYDLEIHKASMDRLEAAAAVIRDDARRILQGQLKGNWKEHGPYKTRWKDGELISYTGEGATGSIWTERMKGAMVKTIRVVRSHDPDDKDVWVMAGNFKTWWAVQLEFGRGAWRGGAKPFLRPAMAMAENRIKGILEGGATRGAEVEDRAPLISGI